MVCHLYMANCRFELQIRVAGTAISECAPVFQQLPTFVLMKDVLHQSMDCRTW